MDTERGMSCAPQTSQGIPQYQNAILCYKIPTPKYIMRIQSPLNIVSPCQCRIRPCSSQKPLPQLPHPMMMRERASSQQDLVSGRLLDLRIDPRRLRDPLEVV